MSNVKQPDRHGFEWPPGLAHAPVPVRCPSSAVRRLVTTIREASVEVAPQCDASNRWPHIRRFLWVDEATDRIDDDYLTWHFATERVSFPSAKVAAAYEEWADFFEWCLAWRADELAAGRVKRHLVEEWTDSMAYCCRRSAAWARGDDPGEWVPQHQRRPDLDAEGRAIVIEIIAGLDAWRQPAGAHADWRLSKVG